MLVIKAQFRQPLDAFHSVLCLTSVFLLLSSYFHIKNIGPFPFGAPTLPPSRFARHVLRMFVANTLFAPEISACDGGHEFPG